MAFDPVTAALEVGNKLIDHFFPDATKQAEARQKLLELQQTGALAQLTSDTSLANAQIAVNLEQAKSTNMFIAGPRPAIMWIAAVALALAYWPKAIFLSGMWVYQAYSLVHGAPDVSKVILPVYPDLGVTDLIGLLGSVLGLGGLRTYEKRTGTEGNR